MGTEKLQQTGNLVHSAMGLFSGLACGPKVFGGHITKDPGALIKLWNFCADTLV